MKKLGFTLIELIVVIVILGILAVTAAPRFLNLQSDARKATLEATKGALEGAFQIFSAKAQVPSAEFKISDATGDRVLVLNGFEYGFTDDFYPILPLEAISSLDPLLSLVNLDVHLSDGERNKGLIYEYDPTNLGFILFFGTETDVSRSRCYISYSPDKEHNVSELIKGDYIYVENNGC